MKLANREGVGPERRGLRAVHRVPRHGERDAADALV